MRATLSVPFAISFALLLNVAACSGAGPDDDADREAERAPKPPPPPPPPGGPTGSGSSYSKLGAIPTGNAFFHSISGNGRACVDCHQPAQGWTITPQGLRAAFNASDGLAPVFRTVDGATAPTADISTVDKRRTAFALLLSRGLIRVQMPMPASPEFEVVGVDDPYAYAGTTKLSLYRRPLPAANTSFLSTVMWDGREMTGTGGNLRADLMQQANDATVGHAEGTPLTDAQRAEIADFELSLFFAQSTDNAAGALDLAPAKGGPVALASTSFFQGINDPFGHNPTGAAFNAHSMTLYDGWAGDTDPARGKARDAIARGAAIFGSKKFNVTNVGGLNDDLGAPTISATCTTCHDSPNVGNHSVALLLDIGVATAPRRRADVPLYTLRNLVSGATIRTSDPGRAMVTGHWKDISKFKVPVLRGLPARAPYFHDGSANSIHDVIDFYDRRFNIRLTPDEKDDLAAFLSAL